MRSVSNDAHSTLRPHGSIRVHRREDNQRRTAHSRGRKQSATSHSRGRADEPQRTCAHAAHSTLCPHGSSSESTGALQQTEQSAPEGTSLWQTTCSRQRGMRRTPCNVQHAAYAIHYLPTRGSTPSRRSTPTDVRRRESGTNVAVGDQSVSTNACMHAGCPQGHPGHWAMGIHRGPTSARQAWRSIDQRKRILPPPPSHSTIRPYDDWPRQECGTAALAGVICWTGSQNRIGVPLSRGGQPHSVRC